MAVSWQDIEVVEDDTTETPCDCCGRTTTRIDGDLEVGEDWLAFYSVQYTRAHPDRPALFQLGTGDWSDDAAADTRWMFEAAFLPDQEGFALLDSSKGRASTTAIWLDREDILGCSFAAEAFAMMDAVLLKDSRLEHLRA